MSDVMEQNTTEAQIEQYDNQIATLVRQKNELVNEKNALQQYNTEHTQCYDAAINAKNQLNAALEDVVSHARTARQKFDGRKVKLMRELYEYIESSSHGTKVSNQFDNLNSVMSSISNEYNSNETQITDLTNRINNINAEIERLKSLRGGLVNG